MGRGPPRTGGGPRHGQHCPAPRAPLSPPGERCRGHCLRNGPPIGVIRGLSRILRIRTPPAPWSSRTTSGCWNGSWGRTCPRSGNCCCWVLDWRLGWGWPAGTWWTTSSAPPEVQPGPPVCTHHPVFLSRSAHGISPVTVREGEILMWNGAYEMEVVKANSMDGDAEVTWALGATLPPTRPAPAWRLLHAVPEWKRAKESKKGTWIVTCPCECEVCIVFGPVFARSSREVCHPVLRVRICSFTNFTRSSREIRANFT